MAKEIGTNVTQMAHTISVLMGIAGILTTPLARIYGKRPGKDLSAVE